MSSSLPFKGDRTGTNSSPVTACWDGGGGSKFGYEVVEGKSDNPFIRLLRMLFGFGIVALLLLTALTVNFSFPEKSTVTNATAQVQSCEDHVPLSRRGFGPRWNCTALIRRR